MRGVTFKNVEQASRLLPFSKQASRLFYSLSRRAGKNAMSLVEIMVVVSTLAVLAAVLIPFVLNVIPSTKSTVATTNLEQLNRAVLKFNHANWELVLATDAGSSEDESDIFRTLQYRAASNPSPGAPYLDPTLAFVSSSDEQTYRAAWNGRMFEMLAPGESGDGLDLSGMVSGTRTAATFAANYQPVGAPQ